MTRGGALEVLPLHVSGMYSQPAHVCVPRGLGVRKNRGCLHALPTSPCSAHGSSSMTSRFCQPNWTSGSRDKDKQARQRCALRCIQYSSYACARCPPSWSRSQGSLMMSQARIGLRMTRTHTTRRRAGPNSSMLRGCSNDCHPTPRPVAFRPINRFFRILPNAFLSTCRHICIFLWREEMASGNFFFFCVSFFPFCLLPFSHAFQCLSCKNLLRVQLFIIKNYRLSHGVRSRILFPSVHPSFLVSFLPSPNLSSTVR